MSDRVLVIGGTRGTGLLIGNLLLQNGYRVRAASRTPGAAKGKINPGVELIAADVTDPDTLQAPLKDVDHIIFAAGVTKRPAGEQLVRATEYDGVRNTLTASQQAGLRGRFLYKTSIGVRQSSLAATILNLVKRNTLVWRRRAEDEIRSSGLLYTIIRAGLLTNAQGGSRAIDVGQRDHALGFKYKIARADVAEVFVQALKHPRTSRTTFEVVWGKGGRRERWDTLFSDLEPDA
jgi:uncharacterized protein YbjT (DUF2867 family)